MGQAVRAGLHAAAPPSTPAGSLAGTDAFSRGGSASRGTGAGIGLPAGYGCPSPAGTGAPRCPDAPARPPPAAEIRGAAPPSRGGGSAPRRHAFFCGERAGIVLGRGGSVTAGGRREGLPPPSPRSSAAGPRAQPPPVGPREGGREGAIDRRRVRRCAAAPAPPSRCLCPLASPASASHLRRRPPARPPAVGRRSRRPQPAPPSRSSQGKGRKGKGKREPGRAAKIPAAQRPAPTVPRARRRTPLPRSCWRRHLLALPPSSARGALNSTRHRAPLRTDVTHRSRR